MNIFRAEWIVLQVIKFSDQELLYKIFFREYGILSVKKKKKTREKPIDIGYIISWEIITKKHQEIHTIGNIKILTFFETSHIKYSEIERFMKILSKICKELPVWSPHIELFDIIHRCMKDYEYRSPIKLLLTELKITQCFWELTDTHFDITTQKILKFIHKNPYKDIMRLVKIPQEALQYLEDMSY